MKIIFVNRFFYPDISATSQMLSDQAFSLARDGHEVVVIAARWNYAAETERLPAEDVIDGVRVHRVWTSSFGRHRLRGRALDYLTFFLTAVVQLARIVRRGDVVVTKTDPPLLSILTTPLCKLSGAKSVNWLQDVFPEVAERLGIGHGRVARLCHGAMRTVRSATLRLADRNVVLGPVMRAHIEGLGVRPERIVEIPNWADGRAIRPVARNENPLRREWGLGGDFVVSHSGNLGRAHDFRHFLEAIELLEERAGTTVRPFAEWRERVLEPVHVAPYGALANAPEPQPAPKVRWLFIGGGLNFAELEAAVGKRSCGSVLFKPYQPREQLHESLSCADAQLVTLRPEMEGLIVPSKAYGCMAAGRPIIFVGSRDGEIARLIQRHHCGLVVTPDNPLELADAIEQLAADGELALEMGRNARRAFEDHFDIRHARNRWRQVVRELGEEAHARHEAGQGSVNGHREELSTGGPALEPALLRSGQPSSRRS